jgi:hypothetical protein
MSFQYDLTHSGQKRAYGDTFHEYEVRSDLPAAEVEAQCVSEICKAMPFAEWQEGYRSGKGGMEHAFTKHYKFTDRGDGKYFYQVISLYTD